MEYSELHLHDDLQKGISDAGYITCTSVQEQVLKVSLNGSDLYVQSQTGTGKTAAYLISIIQEMLTRSEMNGRKALIMVPTRELAVQVEDEAKKLSSGTKLVCASFYGGVGYEQQVAALKRGVDIIIGTPGRVIDLNEGHQMDLRSVGFLVIDEADRMFDMGFYPDLRKLIKVLPESSGRQTMLFSATLNSYVKNLAWEYTKDAIEITIAADNITVDEIDQELIHVSSDEKIRLLLGILAKENPASVVVFCNTKRMCEVLSKRLKINGVGSEFIIGDLPQSKRLKIMDAFKTGKIRCLVATDVAARGIDVSDLSMVVNYDLPNEAENYVHRIGRTARAGRSGKAYTFCSEQDVYSLVPIERYIEKQIPSRVAAETDLAEDKSKGVYIRTENWREEFDGHGRNRDSDRPRRSDSSRRSDKPHDRSRDTTRRTTEPKTGRTGQNRGAERRAVDPEKLSKMSFDDRMKVYKEKYEHGMAPANRTKPAAAPHARKNYRTGNNMGQNTAPQQTRKIPAAPVQPAAKKTQKNFLGKVLSFFGKK
jgi:ATP-dependent RNA helicase RhlB